MVVGMVNDKDINGVLSLMPQNAIYYFTQASVKRAMPADEFAGMARNHGLKGDVYDSVSEALKQAVADSSSTDMIFVGGSTFIVADALLELETNNQ
jgi:dihydrofolate synthase/folylpolyglutamate synthase